MLFEIFKYYASPYLNDKIYTYSLQLPNLSVGSKQLRQISWKSTIENVKELETPIAEFVEFIWTEAIGDLREIFEDNFEKLSADQV
jgi:hypothetical protein